MLQTRQSDDYSLPGPSAFGSSKDAREVGRLHFTTGEGDKSAEGSLACFVVALLCTLVPLLLFTQTGRSQTLLIALIVALLATMLEAVAWRGLK